MAPLITTPTFKETLLYGPASIAAEARARATYDLRSSYGAYLLARVGRDSAYAPDGQFALRVYRNPNFTSTGSFSDPYGSAIGTYILGHPAPVFSALGGTALSAATTVSTNASAGATTLIVTSAAGFNPGDGITIGGNSSYPRWEVNRVARVSGSSLLLETPLIFAHTAAQADAVVNKADFFAAALDGGAFLEVEMDASLVTNGAFDIEVFLQEYTNDVTQ